MAEAITAIPTRKTVTAVTDSTNLLPLRLSIGGNKLRSIVVEVDIHNLVARDCHSGQNAGGCLTRRWFNFCVCSHLRLVCQTFQCLSLATDYPRH